MFSKKFRFSIFSKKTPKTVLLISQQPNIAQRPFCIQIERQNALENTETNQYKRIYLARLGISVVRALVMTEGDLSFIPGWSKKGGVGRRGCEAFLPVNFFLKCSNTFIFWYCGRNVFFFNMSKFQDTIQPPSFQTPSVKFLFKLRLTRENMGLEIQVT